MKRIVCITAAIMIMLMGMAGCGTPAADGEIDIVCTVYPVYDWLNKICNGVDSVNITMLGANGTDIHSYQPTAADIAAIAKADMTVVIGGVSDQWVSDAADKNGKGVTLSLIDTVEDKLLVAGEDNHTADHDHAAHEYDEHVWLSPDIAKDICTALSEKLAGLDSDNAATFNSNCADYLAQLDELDAEFARVIGAADSKAVVIADRYPFRYLMNEYGLDCHAAYDGCSADADADFDTVTGLAAALNEHELNAVLIIEGSNAAFADSVIAASGRENCEIFDLDSMQSTTLDELDSDTDYIEIMKSNLTKITAALER